MALRRKRVVSKTIHAPWWDEDEEVRIRQFSLSDLRSLREHYLLETDTRLFVGENMSLAYMEAAIVSWTLKDEVGGILPLDRENISLLPGEDGEYIVGAIIALNKPRGRPTAERRQ